MRATVEASEFAIRSPIDPFGSSLIEPTVLSKVVAIMVDSGRGIGLAHNQVRIDTTAPVLIDRGLEGYFPETQILVRINPQQVTLQCARATRNSRVTAAVFFDELVRKLGPVLGTTNGGVTTWSLHVKEDVRPQSPPPPPLGESTPTGFVFNYGAAPWDQTILATSFVMEPSTLVPQGTFLSLTNVWAKDQELFVKRLDGLWSQWQTLAKLELFGELA